MNDMRVLVCGSRYWSDSEGLWDSLDAMRLPITEVIHGAARGADSLGAGWAISRGIKQSPFPADWAKHQLGAGPIRNRRMLDEKPDLVVAFSDNLYVGADPSKGTRDCVDEARRRGIPVWHVFHPVTR